MVAVLVPAGTATILRARHKLRKSDPCKTEAREPSQSHAALELVPMSPGAPCPGPSCGFAMSHPASDAWKGRSRDGLAIFTVLGILCSVVSDTALTIYENCMDGYVPLSCSSS